MIYRKNKEAREYLVGQPYGDVEILDKWKRTGRMPKYKKET